MNYDIVIANSVGINSNGEFIIHSPSRWSEAFKDSHRLFSYYPFGLGYLSSILKSKTSLKVKMVDGCLEELNAKAYFQKIISLNPKFLFMESSSMTFKDNLKLALKVKEELGTKILFAGPHVSVFFEELIGSGIDFLFLGEYEASVYDFFKKEKFMGKEKVFLKSDSIAFPCFPWPEDNDISRFDYAFPGEPSSSYKEIQIHAGRGCKGQCSFCVSKNIYYNKKKCESRIAQSVLQEMNFLKEKYPDCEGFFFDEEDHFNNIDFINEFTSLLIKNNHKYKIEALGRINNLNLNLIKKLKMAGYYKLRIGIESLDADIQKTNFKKISIQKMDEVLHALKDAGVEAYLTFQVGLPGSNKEKDLNTLLIIKERILKKMITNLQISIFTPFPGTPAYDYVCKYGAFESKDLKEFNGGKKAVVSWPDYSCSEINSVYEQYLRERDHIQFRQKIFGAGGIHWIYSKLRKHSIPTIINKVNYRLKNEIKYCQKNWN